MVKAGLFLFSIFFTLAIAEVAARLVFGFDPATMSAGQDRLMEITPKGLRLRPGASSEIRDTINNRNILVSVNSFGFRGPEPNLNDQHKKRVLFLGDSVVFGPGLSWDETIPARLSAELGPGVEVLNGGVTTMSMSEEVDHLAEKIKIVKPDLVLLGFYLNDSKPSYYITDEYGGMDRKWAGVLTRTRSASALFNGLWEGGLSGRLVKVDLANVNWVKRFQEGKWKTDRAAFDELTRLMSRDLGAAWDENSWLVIENEAARFKEICVSHGSSGAVVIFPPIIQTESQVADDYPQKQMKRIAAAQGLLVLDLLPKLKTQQPGMMYLDHCHYTPYGSNFVSEEIANWIEGEALLK